jgi:hypothetical protein
MPPLARAAAASLALLLACHALLAAAAAEADPTAPGAAAGSAGLPRVSLARRPPTSASLCGQQAALRARYGQVATGSGRLTGGEDIPLVDFMDAQVRRGGRKEHPPRCIGFFFCVPAPRPR